MAFIKSDINWLVVELLLLLDVLAEATVVELVELAEAVCGGGGGGPFGALACMALANCDSVRLPVPPLSSLENRAEAWSALTLSGRPATNSAWVTEPSPLVSSWANNCAGLGGPLVLDAVEDALEDESVVEAVEELLALVSAAIRFCSRLSMELSDELEAELVLVLSDDDVLSRPSAWWWWW